jgi:CdiI immunity protein
MVTMPRNARQDEIRDELPQLAYLFDAYFHQDSLYEETPDEVIESFIRAEWPHSTRTTWLELVALLGRPLDDEELQAVVMELGADVYPTPDATSLRAWLEGVRDRLAEAPLTRFGAAVPVIRVRNPPESAVWYRDTFAFEIVHSEPEWAIVERDDASIHFRGPSGIEPEDSNTMLRIRVGGIHELYRYCQTKGIVDPDAPLEKKPWGAWEFPVTDLDSNLVTFFELEVLNER